MKKYGDTQTSDEASLVMEKMDFEDKVSLNPLDYDSWSDLYNPGRRVYRDFSHN